MTVSLKAARTQNSGEGVEGAEKRQGGLGKGDYQIARKYLENALAPIRSSRTRIMISGSRSGSLAIQMMPFRNFKRQLI